MGKLTYDMLERVTIYGVSSYRNSEGTHKKVYLDGATSRTNTSHGLVLTPFGCPFIIPTETFSRNVIEIVNADLREYLERSFNEDQASKLLEGEGRLDLGLETGYIDAVSLSRGIDKRVKPVTSSFFVPGQFHQLSFPKVWDFSKID